MNILIGCDPEVFVTQHGVYKSAHNLIKGDKKNPQRVDRGAVQVDGMALEFNIDPAASEDEFCLNVNTVFHQLELMVPDYKIAVTPTAKFDPAYMKEQPEKALELGCDPDYNAWSFTENIKPDGNRPMRTAAGHIHIGWTQGRDINDPAHVEDACLIGRQMDFYIGLGSCIYDRDQERRSMYGKAGCIRIKPYGVEYRTPSNAWLNSEYLMKWVFRNAKKGVEAAIAGDDLSTKVGDIQYIINNGYSTDYIKEMMDRYNLEIPNECA